MSCISVSLKSGGKRAVHKVHHAIFHQFYTLPLSHISGPPQVRHTSRTKAPCTKSLSIVRRGFCARSFVREFCLEGFVRIVFDRSSFCQNTSDNRKLNITFNFWFHMYDKKFKNVTSHALDSLLCHKVLHLLR